MWSIRHATTSKEKCGEFTQINKVSRFNFPIVYNEMASLAVLVARPGYTFSMLVYHLMLDMCNVCCLTSIQWEMLAGIESHSLQLCDDLSASVWYTMGLPIVVQAISEAIKCLHTTNTINALIYVNKWKRFTLLKELKRTDKWKISQWCFSPPQTTAFTHIQNY